jgi:DNA replication protein DnaC
LQQVKDYSNLSSIFKAGLKRIVPELRDRDDFQVEAFKSFCVRCEKQTCSRYRYKFDDSDTWIEPEENEDICRFCRDQSFFEDYQPESIKQQKLQIQERLTNEYLEIPDDLRGAGFKTYKETNEITKTAKAEAMKYVRSFKDDRYNLLLMGNPGTGKSHLCAAIARTLRASGFTVGFITTGALFNKIKATYNKGSSRTEAQIIEDIKKFELLVLDDVGSEAKSSNDDWGKKTIFEIVNSRIGKPTIYTSNLNDKTLPTAIGERAFSRLYNNTKFIDLFTEDYRKSLRR